ncbi:chloride conductance regulatory protein ICln-like protein [Carex littledalei]|uniref:Chloride conductance regulatory protein ICln-like protein n=1 Tax=Carex littledalei TaxID=544730 RepID=A0A833RPP0_9POAL|nr:chloride conductance regulatory protein ICln-like protein [Carex littledalei]
MRKPTTIQATSYRQSDPLDSAGMFVGGFVLGGLIIGALGCVYAPQIAEPWLEKRGSYSRNCLNLCMMRERIWRRVLWLSDTEKEKGYSVDFVSISLHAVSRDPEAYPQPCIYTQRLEKKKRKRTAGFTVMR